jgi:hypothetical protein
VTDYKNRLRGSTSLTPQYADPLAQDFRNFVFAIWQHLGLPTPTVVQYDIAVWLQHGPRRLVTEAFRGVGKSWITAAFVLWQLYRNPQTKIMVVSANAIKAAEFTTFCLQLLRDVEFLRHLEPRHDQRQSTIAFDVAPASPDPSPSVKSVGITGQLTGSRADIIVADDIEIPHNSDTQGKRDRILELIKEFDAVLKPGGRIIYLGTPQTEQSVYNALPERGYVIRIWPARYPRDLSKYGTRLAPMIAKALEANPKLAGQPTDAIRFDAADLDERELSYGRSGFALQFMLDTALSDAEKHPLKLADLIVHPCDPYRAPIDFAWAAGPDQVVKEVPIVGLHGDRYYRPMWCSSDFAEYESCVMAVDPSGRGKDETSYAVVKLLHGRLFLVASGGFLGGYDDPTLLGILKVAKKHDVRRIISEPNYGGGMFTRLLQSAAQQHYPQCGIEEAEWSSVAKEQRIIDTLEPVLNQHRLIVDPQVIVDDYESTAKYDGERAPEYRLFYQMARMVRQKGALRHDDRLDALAMAVAYFLKSLSRDTQQAVQDHREAQLDKELERFLAHALGGQPQGGRKWASTTAREVLNPRTKITTGKHR